VLGWCNLGFVVMLWFDFVLGVVGLWACGVCGRFGILCFW